MENRHVIGKLSLDLQLRASVGSDPFDEQRRADSFCKNQLLPALESLFDRLAAPSELLIFEKINIQLAADWSENLLDEILREVERQLEMQLLEAKINTANHEPTDLMSAARRVPLAVGRFEQWLFFLENGVLPLGSAALSQAEIERASLETIAAEATALDRFLKKIGASSTAFRRLIWQHDRAFLAELLAAAAGSAGRLLLDELSELEHLFAQKPTTSTVSFFSEKQWIHQSRIIKNQLADNFFEHAFRRLISNEKQLDRVLPDALAQVFASLKTDEAKTAWAEILAEQVVKNLPKNPSVGAAILSAAAHFSTEKKGVFQKTELKPSDGELSVFPQKKELADELIFPKKEATKPTEQAVEQPVFSKKEPLEAEPFSIEKQTESAIFEQKTTENKSISIENEPFREFVSRTDDSADALFWFVKNGGLVVLNPFLSPFFNGLGLLKNGQFSSRVGQERAIWLLHFLATGCLETAEFELVFEKFMVGWPIAEPLRRRPILKKKERDEAEKLLRAVIGHWKWLSGTTPDGLREGFLQRSAKLSRRADGQWLLQVEASGRDVLLGGLPWGLGLIKWSWLPDFLNVDWV